MATKPVDKGFSVNRFDGNGSETVWEFSFEGSYLSREYVKAYSYNTVTREETPVAFTWVNDFSILVTPAIPTGSQLVVYRDTPKDTLLVDFRAGALRTPDNLHKDFTQALNVATEAMDEANSMTAAADYAVDTAELALSVANMASSSAATAVVIAEGAESTAEAAEGAAAQAVSTANTAKDVAEGIDAQVKDAVAKAESAVSTAGAAQAAAGTAVSTANTAKATAEGIDAKATAAVSTANTAKSTADTAKSTADAVDAKATAAQNSAALAAAQAQTAANDAAASAAAVAGKADKAYVDAVKATADAAMPKSGGTFTGTVTHQGNVFNQYINGGTIGAVQDETAHLRVGKLAEGNAGWASSATFGSDGALTLTGSILRWGTNDLGAWANVNAYYPQFRAVVVKDNAGPDSDWQQILYKVPSTDRVIVSAYAEQTVAGYDYYSIYFGGTGTPRRTSEGFYNRNNANDYGTNLYGTTHFRPEIADAGSTVSFWREAPSSTWSASNAIFRSDSQQDVQVGFIGNNGSGGHNAGILRYFAPAGEFEFRNADAGGWTAVRGLDFYGQSDLRQKNIQYQRYLSLDDILTLQLAVWEWKDGSGRSSGVIAQEVQKLMPELVHEDADGNLAISEAKVALNIAMSLAQHLKSANERITSLERALYGR